MHIFIYLKGSLKRTDVLNDNDPILCFQKSFNLSKKKKKLPTLLKIRIDCSLILKIINTNGVI